MKFSIITTTLNSEKTLEDTIKSVANQQNIEIEYIVIDGGSTDKTINIIKRSNCVSILKSQPGLGIYEGLNMGLSMATGDIVGFLHSDDLFASVNILSEIEAIFEQNHVDGVYGDLNYFHKNNTNWVVRKWKSKIFEPSLLRLGWMPPHPTLFLKRKVYISKGVFNSTYRISADYDFVLRTFKDQSLKFYYLPKIITKMRIGGTSNRTLYNILVKLKEDLNIIRFNKVGGIDTLILKNLSKIKQFFN